MSELKSFGESRRFALGFRLSKDPDSGVTIEDRQLIERLSWGEVQIWVGDRNLTLGRFADGDTTHSAQVPLFPIIEWLVNNWNPLLNEEALPRKSESVSAAEWKRASTQNLFGDSTEIDELLSDRELWWQRHSFGAALPGFRVPDFHIRRKGDQAELSWDDSDWRSIEGGVSLMEQPGSLLLPIDEVAKTLFEFSNGVLKAIHGLASQESIESESLSKLMTQLKNLEHPDHHFERIRWSARTDIEKLAKYLIKKSGIHEDEIESSVQTILGLSETRPVASLYAPLTLPTLLFRSASPALSLNDLEKLLEFTQHKSSSLPSILDPYRKFELPPGSPQSITSDGYEKALELREELGIDSELPLVGELDLEASIIRERLGITVQEVFLDDTGIDGVALAGPQLAPSIIINKSGRASSRPTGRRSTLAHELCHLLFDGQSEGYVGVVSNDWADYALERRANAFAAMLLAPAEAIEKILGPKAIKREQKDILEAMQKLDIGLVMLTRQMQNLGWLSESEQQALIQDFTTT